MAAPKSNKAKTQDKANGMMGMVSKVCAVIAALLASLFFAAMFDIGHMGLIRTLAGMAIVLVPLFAIVAIAAMFLTPKSGADTAATANAAQISDLIDFQIKATQQILLLQNQIDSISGQDNETLRARNKELQAELDAIHQAERDKVDGEIEALRQRNVELEAQIKKWAFEAVGKTVAGAQPQPQPQPQPMKAA